MMTPILSDFDVRCILSAADEAITDREKYAHILHSKLVEVARAVNIKNRFWEATYHGRPTRFVLTQLPIRQRYNGTYIVLEDVINEQGVLDWFEKSCGKYVQASYEVKDSYHLDVYLEFVPPKRSVFNPEDDVEEVNIPVATAPGGSEELQERRLEKETCW
jgi:hypothetical protein